MSEDIRLKIKFVPKEDITTWELAQCCLWFNRGIVKTDEWPEEDWTRHFETEPYDYGDMIKESAEALENIFGECKL